MPDNTGEGDGGSKCDTTGAGVGMLRGDVSSPGMLNACCLRGSSLAISPV
jgi:hypothetical protein